MRVSPTPSLSRASRRCQTPGETASHSMAATGENSIAGLGMPASQQAGELLGGSDLRARLGLVEVACQRAHRLLGRARELVGREDEFAGAEPAIEPGKPVAPRPAD